MPSKNTTLATATTSIDADAALKYGIGNAAATYNVSSFLEKLMKQQRPLLHQQSQQQRAPSAEQAAAQVTATDPAGALLEAIMEPALVTAVTGTAALQTVTASHSRPALAGLPAASDSKAALAGPPAASDSRPALAGLPAASDSRPALAGLPAASDSKPALAGLPAASDSRPALAGLQLLAPVSAGARHPTASSNTWW
jgi:hypothetical protein